MKRSNQYRDEPTENSGAGSRLRTVALVVAVTMVIARATMLETLREPFGPRSALSAGHSAGPDTSVILDLLCCVPALLVLVDRAIKKRAPFARSKACVAWGFLAAWTGASVIWADDKFSAAVTASHVIAAFALAWAVAQCVTSWREFRPVASICAGLLLVYLAQAVVWRFVEMPMTLETFEKHKTEYLSQLGMEPNSFSARQFEKKVQNLEMLGFNGSSNSFAATMVLLLGVTGGLLLQRLADGLRNMAVLIAMIVPPTFWILYYTQSKAAFVTPVLVAVILFLVWRFRQFLRARRSAAFVGGCAIVVAGIAGVVGYGLVFHRLPTASLNFRWRYWVAAWQVFLPHPLIGVGWDNFGSHYLRYRLPVAAEEIQDPHDFVLRFLTELGIMGAALGLAWLGRLWWEMTAPILPDETVALPNMPPRNYRIGWIALVAGMGMAVSFLASADLSQFNVIDVMKQMLFFCVLMLGTALAAIKPGGEACLEERPAPWVLYGILASLAAFLIHNLIEFSLFEIGPMFLFALLAGCAMGIRSRPTVTRLRSGNVMALGAVGAAFSAAAIFFVVPVGRAESLAHEADAQMRSSHFDEAARNYLAAFDKYIPFNADYLYRAAMATDFQTPADHTAVKTIFDRAIAANPSVINYYLSRARLELQLGEYDAAKADFSRALELDPIEVSIHLDYADALMQMKSGEEAFTQFQEALKYNELLPVEEPKRLNDAEIRLRYASALKLAGQDQDAVAQAHRAIADNDSLSADDPRRLGQADLDALQKIIGVEPHRP